MGEDAGDPVGADVGVGVDVCHECAASFGGAAPAGAEEALVRFVDDADFGVLFGYVAGAVGAGVVDDEDFEVLCSPAEVPGLGEDGADAGVEVFFFIVRGDDEADAKGHDVGKKMVRMLVYWSLYIIPSMSAQHHDRAVTGFWGVCGAIGFFVMSYWVYSYALVYSAEMAGSSVPDFFLDHVPYINTVPVIFYGTVLFVLGVLALLGMRPRQIPYFLKVTGLFILVRAFFIILTHMGPPPDHGMLEGPSFMYAFFQGADFFFSGHTGYPFLLALLYWKNIRARLLFLACSVTMAVCVLLARLHYSIDVFAAYFIVYGIFQIGQRVFWRDARVFHA